MENELIKVEEYSITQPMSAINLASTVEKFINDKKLYSNIQGKKYVNVEGWQFAGLNFGLMPIINSVTNLTTENEIKYQTEVYLVDMNGIQRGYGLAVCSNKERTKKSFEEYAICSMSQTRAIGKAYRNTISWLMKASGFEATPSEEVEEKKRDIPTELRSCETVEELIFVWESIDTSQQRLYKNLKDELKDKLK